MFQPLAAQTLTGHKCVNPSAYDCVRFLLVRCGSMILYGDCTDHPVSVGDVVLIAPHSFVGYAPEGELNLSTLTTSSSTCFGNTSM